MASGNEFSTIFSVEFEDLASVKAKLDVLKKKIGQSNTSGIKVDVDTSSINKMIDDISKLSKTNIQVLPDGQIRMINTLNDELGKTVKLTTDLSTGKSKIDLTNDFAKQEKEKQKLIEQRQKVENDYNNWWLKALKDKELKETANQQKLIEERQRLEQNYDDWWQKSLKDKELKETNAEQKLIEQMAKGREQAELKKQQAIKKSEELQAKAINKEIESSQKIKANAKEEELNARKLIEYEKQKLQIRLKGIELNRGSLINKDNSSKISTGISNLDGKTTKEVRENVRQLSLELDKLDQSAKLKGVEVGQKSVSSLGDAFKTTASKMGIFLSTTVVIRELAQQIREATQYIIDMDKSMTNIMMITGRTSNEVSGITEEFKQLGSQLHTTNREMMASSEEMLRAGYDTETSKKMMEASVIGSKVSGQTSKEVSEQLIAIKNAFNMTGDEMESVIDKMARLDNTSATSFKELAEATKRTAFSAQEMGTSYSDLLAYITTASEKTRKPAETIGESMKSIYSRYSSIKLGNMDEDGKSINDVEKALGRLDIKLRDSKNSFRDYDMVLKEFMDKIKQGNVSQIDKLAVVQALAGTRQKETLLAIIENTDALKKHQEDLVNSTGSAKKMFEDAYSDSLDARINDLKRSFEGLYESILNSSTLKLGIQIPTDVINGVSFLIDKLGALPTALSIAGTAFLMFNKNANQMTKALMGGMQGLTGLEKKLTTEMNTLQSNINLQNAWDANNKKVGISTNGLGTSLLGLNTKLALTEMKLIGVKVASVALQSAFSFGLSLVISTLISKFAEFIDSMITTQAELKEMNDEFNNSFTTKTDNISNAEKLLTQYKSISSEMGNLKQNSDEYKSKEQELLDIQNQLVGIYPELNQYLKDNADAKNGVADATQNLINKSKEELAGESRAILKENDISDTADLDKMIAKFQSVKDEYYKLMELDKQGVEVVGTGFFDSMTGLEEMRNVEDVLKSTKSEYESLTTIMETVRNAISNVASEYPQYAGSLQLIDDLLKSETESLQQNTQAKEENANVQYQHLSPEEAVEGVKQATQEYGKANKEANELRKTIAEINENGLSTDIITDLSEKYSELGYKINDASAVQEYLNQKLSEQEQIAQQSYTNMMMNDSQFYQDKIANNEEFTNAFISMLDTMVQNDGQACDIELGNYTNLLDLKNDLQNRFGDATSKFLDGYINIFMSAYTFDSTQYASLQEAKTGYLNQTLGAVAQWASQFVGVNAQSYGKDLQNFQSLSGAKNKVLQDLNAKMKVIQQNYNDLLSDAKARADEMGDPTFNNSRALASAGKELREIQGAIAGVNVAFQGLEVGYNKLNTSFNAGSFKGGSFNGGKGSSSKGGSGSKASEKQVEDIDNLKDRYYELDLALQKVENSMAMLNTQMKNAKDEEKIKLIKEEVVLLTKKKQALENIYAEQQKEIQDYRNALYSQGGFTFNGDDTIHNYSERMDELQNWANSFSNPDDKKNAQDQYQSLAKMVEEYTQLISKTVPETKEKIEDIQNAITSAYQEEADIMKKQVDKHKELLNKRYEDTKKSIDREKDLLNKKWKNEDEQDDINEKQKKLNELKAELDNALRTGDESLIKNIQLQMAEAQKELDNYIRDAERDKANQMFDDEQNALDEELQRKLDMIEEKLGDEDLLQYAMQGITDLTSVITDIDKTTTGVNRSFMMVSDTVTSIGDNIKTSWISGLDEVSAKIKEMSSELNNSFDFGNVQPILNGVISPIATDLKGKNQEITLNFGGIEKLDITKSNSDEIKNALEDNFNKIIKEVMNIIGG